MNRNRLVALIMAVCICTLSQNPAFSQDGRPADMPHPRVGMCSARLDDKLYLIGGSTSNMQGMRGIQNLEYLRGTRIVDAFDFDTMTWDTTIAPLNTPRAFATAAVIDDSIYVMGGVDNQGRVLNSVEVYDPVGNRWRYAASMLEERVGAASVVYNGYLLVFGGGGDFGVLHREVEAYNPDAGIWRIMADSTIFGRAFHHVAKIGNSVFVFGGIGANIGPFGIIERWIPGIGTVSIRLTWQKPRAYFGMVSANDSVYAISGLGPSGMGSTQGYYSDVELLNFGAPGDGSEHETSVSLGMPRVGFVAAQDDDGQIYLFGGVSPSYKSGQVPIASVEGVSVLTSVEQAPSVSPRNFSLSQNYPNPFNPTTTIEFDVPPQGANISLDVYNMLGQRVKTLVYGYLNGGRHTVSFDGANMPSGSYIYRLQTENGSIYRKMVLIK